MLYYSTDHNRFYSPTSMFAYAAIHTPHTFPTFYFYDKELSQLDWLKEPTTPFDKLVEQRATQLRQKYDYLILFFSGGTDSITIYNAFKRLNLRIDEIIIYYHNDDSVGHPKQNVDWLLANHYDPTTKITIRDREELPKYYEILKSDYIVNDDYISGSTALTSMNTIMREYRDSAVHGNQKWAAIMGLEKPYLVYRNGGWYSVYADRSFPGLMDLENVEWFYLSMDLSELHLKQVHMLKRGLQQHMVPKEGFNSTVFANQSLLNAELVANWCGLDQEVTAGNIHTQRTYMNNNWLDARSMLQGFRNPLSHVQSMKGFLSAFKEMQSDKTIVDYMVRMGLLDDHTGSVNKHHTIFSKFYFLGN